MSTENEINNKQTGWVEVRGFPGYYVNSIGQIKGIKGDILKVAETTCGYGAVTLHKDGTQCTKYVHRIVADNFIDNMMNLPQINHKNGNKKDNRVENLERCSREYNQQHRYRVLGCKPNIHGEKKVICSNIKGDTVRIFKSISEAARCTGIDIAQISGCCIGRKSYKTAGGYKRHFADLEKAIEKHH